MPDTRLETSASLAPVPDGEVRRTIARRIRIAAADIARHRVQVTPAHGNGEADAVVSNVDADAFVAAHGTFTKGLAHDAYGRVRAGDLCSLIEGLNQAPVNAGAEAESPFPGVYGGPDAGRSARFRVPLYSGTYARPTRSTTARAWESPLAGHTYDLEGADAGQVAIPPAPTLGSAELTAEMAELYGSALLRDMPFATWESDADVADVASMLARLPFFTETPERGGAARRRAARGEVSAATLFRGSTAGAMHGPYVSQFLLVGNSERSSLGEDGVEAGPVVADDTAKDALNRAIKFVPPEIGHAMTGSTAPMGAEDGFIRYGIQTVPQRFAGHVAGIDHMTEWATWLDVQNGSNRKDVFDRYEDEARFIATPRDLATYVHVDALYQAYLNACLILLGAGQPFDIGLPEGAGNPTRDGFATFGGPHILTLVTEVATRALKAVRRQKYNVHLRSRPEALAAGISLAWIDGAAGRTLGAQKADLTDMADTLGSVGLLHRVSAHNAANNMFWRQQYGGIDLGPITAATNALLPMAFPEGSPMHPSYGAGHATVAGACVTMLKAFFEMYDVSGIAGDLPLYDVVNKDGGYAGTYPEALFPGERPLTGPDAMLPCAYEPDPSQGYKTLRAVDGCALTVQGELEKLAANISIGRNFGGVHFYTDYYESVRMGERIAVSILQEQMLTYREPVSVRFRSFDGDHMMIAGTGGSRGRDDALVFVWDDEGHGGTEADFRKWWTRHH